MHHIILLILLGNVQKYKHTNKACHVLCATYFAPLCTIALSQCTKMESVWQHVKAPLIRFNFFLKQKTFPETNRICW